MEKAGPKQQFKAETPKVSYSDLLSEEGGGGGGGIGSVLKSIFG
jgi:hypothetical protein